MRSGFILIAALVLAACIEQPAPIEVDNDMPDENGCDASELQDLVGQPATVLQTMKFGVETRILTPDMAVTMDFKGERLNILSDGAGIITLVVCG